MKKIFLDVAHHLKPSFVSDQLISIAHDPVLCAAARFAWENYHQKELEMARKSAKKQTTPSTTQETSMTTDKTEYDVLFDNMMENHDDMSARSILADWCEDNHLAVKADALRWSARHGKRCYKSGGGEGSEGADKPVGGAWFNAESVSKGLMDYGSDLPKELYEALAVANEDTDDPSAGKVTANHKMFDSPQAAEKALLLAWASLAPNPVERLDVAEAELQEKRAADEAEKSKESK